MFPNLKDYNNIEENRKKSFDFNAVNQRPKYILDFKTGKILRVTNNISDFFIIEYEIEKLIRTQAKKYEIYEDTDYGVIFKKLLTGKKPNDFIKSETKRELELKLKKIKKIQKVENIDVKIKDKVLKIEIDLQTKGGENWKIKY